MVVRRKNILSRWIDTIGQKSIFLLMTNTIGQTFNFFNWRIDTIIVKHDWKYRLILSVSVLQLIN